MLWHHTRDGEECLFQYDKDDTLVGDGTGGVWILSKYFTGEQPAKGIGGLWHVRKTSDGSYNNVQFYFFPTKSSMCTDGNGGVYVLCPMKGGGQWQMWHCNEVRETNLKFKHPQSWGVS